MISHESVLAEMEKTVEKIKMFRGTQAAIEKEILEPLQELIEQAINADLQPHTAEQARRSQRAKAELIVELIAFWKWRKIE